MQKNILDIGFELCMILFSVSLSWSVYNLWQQYPCIVRFGHFWDKRKKDKEPQHRRVIISSWSLLIISIIFSLFSLSKTSSLYKKFNLESYTSLHYIELYIIVGLFGFIYLFIPYLINRLVWGFTLFIAPNDFLYFVKDEKRKEHRLMGRFSEETIDILSKKPVCCGGIIFFNTVLLLILLNFSPLYFIWCWGVFSKSLVYFLLLLIIIIILSLILYFPYGRWLCGKQTHSVGGYKE